MVVTLGQQYNIGEKPTVILYTYYVNRYAGTPYRYQKQNRNNVVLIIYCYIGYKDEFTTTEH